MRTYLKILSICYGIGAILQFLDWINVRLEFSRMPVGMKTWTLYLMVADFFAAIGLWRQSNWGIGLFLFIASSQLIAYINFRDYFGDEALLIGFHLFTISLFAGLWSFRSKRLRPN